MGSFSRSDRPNRVAARAILHGNEPGDPSSVPHYHQSRVFLPLSPTKKSILKHFNDIRNRTIFLVPEMSPGDPPITIA